MNRLFPLYNKEQFQDGLILVIHTKSGQPYCARIVEKYVFWDILGQTHFGYKLFLTELNTFCMGDCWEIIATN